jgi:hypothetical protein
MGQLRKKAKALSVRVREGDRDAASELLQHSVRLGHGKLALRRLFLARAMGAAVSEVDLRFCLSISNKLPREMTKAMAEEERRKAARYMKRKKTDG